MKTLSLLFLLALCLSGCATKPLSPKRAGKPMVKRATAFAPASVPFTEPAPVMTNSVTLNINFFGCNTNDPTCKLYFKQHVSVVHPAGHELTIEFADTANASQWAWAARFGAGPVDRISEFTWFQPEDQRPPQRFFRSRTVIPILPASSTTPVNIVSPALTLATATSRKR